MGNDDDFARVLAEAGEQLAKRDPVEQALAKAQAGLAELYASQVARWLRNEPSRTTAVNAWQQTNAAAGIDSSGDPERWPWMQPPRRPMCW